MLDMLSRLEDKCILCIMAGRDAWNGHQYDACPGSKYGVDQGFVIFKTTFEFGKGYCFGCGLGPVSFLVLFSVFILPQLSFLQGFSHGDRTYGPGCDNRGHVVRIIHALFSYKYKDFFADYHNATLSRTSIEDFRHWAFTRLEAPQYHGETYNNLYDLLVWVADRIAPHLLM